MDFDTWIDDAWSRHADDPGRAAQSLAEGAARVTAETQLVALIGFAHHVHGEHLGGWQAGLDGLDRLAASPMCNPAGVSGEALARCRASLLLSAGDPRAADALALSLSLSDRIRATAMAAANLAQNEAAPDTGRASALWQAALALAAGSGLPADDPAHRTLAATGNNLASALEQKAVRSAAERALMLATAAGARQHWALAGTWLEVERAEYRLASSWLAAADGEPCAAQAALVHAQACLALVDAHAAPALERFFACEVLARAQRLAGDEPAQAASLQAAREAFAQLAADDQAWCAESLRAIVPEPAAAAG